MNNYQIQLPGRKITIVNRNNLITSKINKKTPDSEIVTLHTN